MRQPKNDTEKVEISLQAIDSKHLFYLTRKKLRDQFNAAMGRYFGENIDLQTYQKIETLAKRHRDRLHAIKVLACIAYAYEGYMDYAIETYSDISQLEAIKKHLDRALKLYGEVQVMYEGRHNWEPNGHLAQTLEEKIRALHLTSQRVASLEEYVKGVNFLQDYAKFLQSALKETEKAITSGNAFIGQVLTDEACNCLGCQKGRQAIIRKESPESMAMMSAAMETIAKKSSDEKLVHSARGYQTAMPFLARLKVVNEVTECAGAAIEHLAKFGIEGEDPRETAVAYAEGLDLIDRADREMGRGQDPSIAELKTMLGEAGREGGIPTGRRLLGGEFDNTEMELRELMGRSATGPDEDLYGCGQPHDRPKIEISGNLKKGLTGIFEKMGLGLNEDQIEELIRTHELAVDKRPLRDI